MKTDLIGKRILITGGTGFIGSALVNSLKEKNKVFVVGRGDRKLKGVGYIKADLTKKSSFKFLKDGSFDYIFHLAGNTNHEKALLDPIYDLSLNFISTFYILDKLRSFEKKPKFIFASTVLVYGNTKGRLREDFSATNPISNHGAAKLAAEKYIFTFSRQYGIPAIVLRIFSVYGPGIKRQIVFDFIKKLTKNPLRLDIIGTGKESRDMIYIDDVIANIRQIARFADYKGEIYNIGTGKSQTTLNIGRAIAKSLHVNPKIFFTKKIRSFDILRTVADTKKIRKLGCINKVGFEDGIDRTVAWYKSNIGNAT